MIKENCFAYKKNRCTVLKETYCERENCSFFKTPNKFQRDAAACALKNKQRKNREIYIIQKNKGKPQGWLGLWKN
ncbi:MAG: hypothetical protein RRY24_09005 [Clostridiales bacterium]